MFDALAHLLEKLNLGILPICINFAEVLCILIVLVTVLKALYGYVQSTFLGQENNYQIELGMGLATALQFKMASEILKTVVVNDIDELIVLAATIALCALLSILVNFEMKLHKEEHRKKQESGKEEK